MWNGPYYAQQPATGRGVRAEDKRLNSAPERDNTIPNNLRSERDNNTSLYTTASITAYNESLQFKSKKL